ncbi:hypothetical protein [Granulicella tundricola]|uniref:Uncharacterized protein n=1 Tax=Granulicella tundricola (strain ATCC BAA-1859 / DSM 23138 / MP5ACTX9) TaxID=1198114 RepID=E8WZT2_GRATM|nr:hypothetical protein [Granulicella tundricola]ADW67743.1 hypothetical protein AciX9_0673 [Granulicella tundricola MP5ACTX9]
MDLNTPNFERAEYREPQVIEGYPVEPAGGRGLGPALLFGLGAAVVGCVGYAVVGLSHIMASIVSIGVGWLVGKAMMTGSGGVGGRPYQVAAVLMTYFACSVGDMVDILHFQGIPFALMGKLPPAFLLKLAVGLPFLQLRSNPLNGGLGLLILFFGLQAAWRIAAGGPGFGRVGGGPRMTPFGMR